MSINNSKSILEKINNSITAEDIKAGDNINIKQEDGKLEISVEGEIGGSFAISKEEGNALEQKEDGAYVKNYKNEIDNLISTSIGTKAVTNAYVLSEPSTDMTSGLSTGYIINFDRIINQYGRKITLNPDYSYHLKVGKYKVSTAIRIAGTGYCSYQIYDKTNDSVIGTIGQALSISNSSGLSPNPNATAIIEVEQEIDICVKCIYLTSVNTIYSKVSYLLIEEMPKSINIDPLETLQDHNVEDILFESDTPIISGNIDLLSDYTQFNKLTIIYGLNNKTSNITGECRVDFLKTTNDSKYCTLIGYNDYFISFYHNTNTSLIIKNSSTYGITKIIGVKSKNPVLMNYIANYGDFDIVPIFSGNAGTIEQEYYTSDNISNYKMILMTANMFNKNSNDGFFCPYQQTQLYLASDLLEFRQTDISFGLDARILFANFVNENTFKISYIANNKANTAITKIYGIKGKYDENSSYSDEEIKEGIDEIWKEE